MILLVNDDGIDAPGLRAMYRALRAAGHAVLAVAPSRERSGMSHAITIDRSLTATPRLEPGFFGFAVDGTPTDCTKLALDQLCPEPPRLVVSGINRGPNAGRSIFYSGTVGAAMEAAILGLPALAVSRQLCDDDRNLAGGATLAAAWATKLAASTTWRGKVVNLNIPGLAPGDWRPLALARHGQAGFHETYGKIIEDGRTRWALQGDWSAAGDHPAGDVTMLSAGHPVVSVLTPDLNGPTADQRRLAKLAEETAHG